MILNPLDVAIMNERFIVWLLLVPLKCYICMLIQNCTNHLRKTMVVYDDGFLIYEDFIFKSGFVSSQLMHRDRLHFPRALLDCPPANNRKRILACYRILRLKLIHVPPPHTPKILPEESGR